MTASHPYPIPKSEDTQIPYMKWQSISTGTEGQLKRVYTYTSLKFYFQK